MLRFTFICFPYFKDYVSVDLWLEYCQHSIGGIGTPEGIQTARAVYERFEYLHYASVHND
jgi:hypothetical protein